ncbi:uncharacterized protein LOC134248925, partial [Saccostrea cucullata]|uniref:uncharacterized protein LOC134248925 n=1 Tax=Saccostrea cuccullata TaxID=36930 RepID=UPI002ED64C2B
MASGTTLKVLGKVPVNFKLDDVELQHEMIIADITVDGIQGLDFLRQGMVPIRIMNISDDSRTMYPGTGVGKFTSVDEVVSLMTEKNDHLDGNSNMPLYLEELYKSNTCHSDEEDRQKAEMKKKDGSTRFCVDNRCLSSVTTKDADRLPRIDESLNQLRGAKWFKQVLEKLLAAGLKLKTRKCTLFAQKVKYLGHIISKQGIQTDPEKIEIVKHWPVPMSKTQSHLTSAPILTHPDFTKPFTLDTDASQYAMGTVLSQIQNGRERVVAYASKVLSKSERKHCVTRKELLAVVTFIKNFRPFLYGHKFLVRTDHSSLKWLLRFKNQKGQLGRWLEVISTYDIEIEHRAGKLHGNADGLSGVPCSQCGYFDGWDKMDMSVEHARVVEDEAQTNTEVSDWVTIRKTRTTQYHPQSDGMVKRLNKTIATMLSAYVDENHRDWDESIPYVMMAYRSSQHESTGYSPNTLMLEIQKLKLVGVHFENREETSSKNTKSTNFFPIWTSEFDEANTCVVLVTEIPSESSSSLRKSLRNPTSDSRLIFILKCAALLCKDFTFLWNTTVAKSALRRIELFLTEKKHSLEDYKKVVSILEPCFTYVSTSSYLKLLSDAARLETLWNLFNDCRSPMEVLKYIADQRLSTLAKKYFRLEGYSQHVDETYILLPRSVANIYLKSFEDNIFKNLEISWESNDSFDQRTCTEFECFVHYTLYRDLPTSETVLEYFRTSGYVKEAEEECIIVPSEYDEKVIEKMDVDIIVHKTFKDDSIHEAVVKLLRIPEEVIGWNDERKQRFIEELKKGKSRIHRARVIVVGCAGAGKTTLVERLKHPDRDEMPTTTTTVGLDVHKNVFLVDGGKLILMADAASLSSSSSRDKMITVMDFAGQSAYYACHQVYLTKRAIYLLVTDMSKSMEEKVGQHVCDADGTIFADWKYGDYISFWLQSIRTYCGEEMSVVLVATHKDKLQKSEKSFYDEILHSFPRNQTLKKHLSTKSYFEVEAAPKDNEKILEIQNRLIDLLTSNNEEKSYSHWGEFIPSFWLTVERELEQNREKVMRVSQIKDRFNLELSEAFDGYLDLFRHCWFQLKVKLRVEVSNDIIKIRDMLQFFHEIGYILFFNETNLNEVVILDVQWFIDAFKSLTMDKNQVDVTKASNNSNTKTLTLKDCFETTKDMDEFYQSGKLPCEILQQFWESHDDKDLQENSGSLLKYMERLGLLATGEIFHYIPCVNKTDIDISQLERISSKQHKTSVMHFIFKHCLHHFFFQRVVVACMHKWKYLEIDGKIQLFKNIVLLQHKQRGNVIVIGVNKTAIQLLVYSNSTSRSLRPADTYKVRNIVEQIICSVVSTFHRAVNYEVGFSCLENEKITQECEGQLILEKNAVAFSKLEEGRECDYHTETHYIHWSKMVKHWNKDQGLRLGCFSRERRNSTVEGITREAQTENTKPLLENEERHVYI